MADLVAASATQPTRVLIPHIDDVGVCHGAIAPSRSWPGRVSSPAPRSWCPAPGSRDRRSDARATGARSRRASHLDQRVACLPLAADLTSSKQSGLIDDAGFMWPDVPSVRRHADRARLRSSCAPRSRRRWRRASTSRTSTPTWAPPRRRSSRRSTSRSAASTGCRSCCGHRDLRLGSRHGAGRYRGLAQLQVEARAASMPAIDTFAMGLAMRHLGCEEAFRQMVEQAAPGVTVCVPALQHAGRGRSGIRRMPSGGSPNTSCSRSRASRTGLRGRMLS